MQNRITKTTFSVRQGFTHVPGRIYKNINKITPDATFRAREYFPPPQVIVQKIQTETKRRRSDIIIQSHAVIYKWSTFHDGRLFFFCRQKPGNGFGRQGRPRFYANYFIIDSHLIIKSDIAHDTQTTDAQGSRRAQNMLISDNRTPGARSTLHNS